MIAPWAWAHGDAIEHAWKREEAADPHQLGFASHEKRKFIHGYVAGSYAMFRVCVAYMALMTACCAVLAVIIAFS